MNDVDSLLEDKTHGFYGFVHLLRKSSNQKCQIVTTSTTFCEIPNLTTDKVEVDEMDEKACMKLLKNICSQNNEKF